MSATEKTLHNPAVADVDLEIPPLTDAQLAKFVPLASIPGRNLVERLQNLKKRHTKKSMTVRYDADIVEYYKNKGKGYQQAMNDALRVCMEAEQGMFKTA